jgi:hypothetical protein
LSGDIQAVEPDEGGLNFFRFKARRCQFAAEPLKFGASVTLPVIFVDVHEYFEHASNITQLAATLSRPRKEKRV